MSYFIRPHVVVRICLVCSLLMPSISLADIFDSPLADLVEAQQPGTWLKVNQNKFQSTWIPPKQTMGSSPRYKISAWNSGGYDKNTGDFYLFGGDNGTYSGNEVYRWTASTLSWERLSLASNNTFTYLPSGRKHWHTVDGTNHSPIAGETYDGLVYLSGVNRFVVLGGHAYPGGGRQYFLEDGVTRAGPFFFDPAKADPNKVGGLSGSNVNPTLFPNVQGGNMWENRQSIQTSAGLVGPLTIGNGVSAATTIEGKDVVFVGEAGIGKQGRLFKYTVNSLEASEDKWELVGVMGSSTFSGAGAGAYNPTANVFVRTGKKYFQFWDEATGTYVKRATYFLMYWDLDNPGGENKVVYIHPDWLLGDDLPLSGHFGIDYDPVTDAFYLWKGLNEVWKLTLPETLGPTGWTVQKMTPLGLAPDLIGSVFTGVYGKWNYMEGLGAFMGVVHDLTGDVWVYKPSDEDVDLMAQGFEPKFTGESSLDPWAVRPTGPYASAYPRGENLASVPLPGTMSLALLGLVAAARFTRARGQAHGAAAPSGTRR